MDNRNVFVAIALSMSVLLFWAAFFETPRPVEKDQIQNKDKVKTENSITPNINEMLKLKEISREEAIKKSKRITIENENVIGSLSLIGGLIDDISFKKHKQDLKNNENVQFLNPSEIENGFFVETGWTSVNNKIKVPSRDSLWSVKGNSVLKNNQPVILEWNNGEGIIFKRKIELDKKYLFKITQQIQNNTNKTIDLYPYAQITRNKIPDDIQNFYIISRICC